MIDDPRRLESALLDSARDDAPTSEAEQRARIALGLAAPVIPLQPDTSSTASAASQATAGSNATAASNAIAGTTALAGSTATAIKLVSLVLVIAGAATWLASTFPEHPSLEPLPPAAEAPPPAAEPSELPPTVIEAPPFPVTTPVPVPSSDPGTVRAPAAVPDPQPTLQRELELIRTARAHLESDRFEQAEATLERYEIEIPEGTLREEAAALAIEAAFALDRPEARELANAFLTDYPDSPHAPRARALRDR